MLKNLNFPGVFALIIYPIIIITLAIFFSFEHQIGWLELGLFLTGYYVSNITVGLGFHRLWSHDSYKTNKFVEFILVLLSAGTLQGPALSWASNHFRHHTYTDTDQDPHTPLKYKNNRVMGFLWAHMGWMLVGEGSYRSIDRVTMVKHGRNKLLRWQLKYYWQLALLMNTFVPACVGYLITHNITGAYAGFLFIGLGRALQQQVTFFVNSLCHFVGTQNYIDGTSRDIWWLAFLLLGENWHNFHHAFPSDYRNGAKWYQCDVHKWLIYLMSKCGLAWGLKRTAHLRIKAKINQNMEQLARLRIEKLELMQLKAAELGSICQQRLQDIETSSLKMKTKFLNAFSNTQHNLNSIKAQLQNQVKGFDNPSEKIVKIISKELKKAETSIQKLYSEIEKINFHA